MAHTIDSLGTEPTQNRVLSHFGAFLVHLFGPQKQEKPPLSVFRRGFCQNNGGEDESLTAAKRKRA